MVDYQTRLLEAPLQDALADTPVVLVNGARQTGKTTLVQRVAAARQGRYSTLDDPTELAAAADDPRAYIGDGQALTVIDEVQKAPGLFPAIKLAVDQNRAPGRYLLTGSADVFSLPRISESLAGRIAILTLHPFAQIEPLGLRPRLVGHLFGESAPGGFDGSHLHSRISTGGYPEAMARRRADRRRAWFDDYIRTITQRDIRDLAAIEGITVLPRLLSLIASRSGALMNIAELSRAAGIPQATLRRYLALLEATFLLTPLPAWHANLGKRLIKAPKAYLADSGLACALSGVTAENLTSAAHFGGLLETFVLGELRRQLAAMTSPPRLYHYRTAGGIEADFVLEDSAGRIAAVEVKASTNALPKHFAGLRDLQSQTGQRFARGIVLYGGDKTVAFGERLAAWPIAALWSRR